nr:hypothetical protein [Tanacetum cinerariifolium]
FWSTARIETTEEGTKILVTVDGKLRTVSESSIRRNLKLNNEAGINSLPDAELFENLTLMGYNISPNQKFTFQKGQFSHQWKYLIHTIMQCLSPKSSGFNEFSSNIATALVCLATNRVYNFSKMIFDGMVRNVNNKVSKFLMYPRFLSICLRMGQFGQITHTHTYVVPFHTRKFFTTLRVNSLSFLGRIVPLFSSMLVTMGEGSGTPTEPHHTPTPEATPSPQHELSSSSLPPAITKLLPTVILSDNPPLRQYTRRVRIAQYSALLPVVDEPASPIGDDSQGDAFLTDSGLEADQDRENILKTSTLPSDSTPRVTSLAADKGSQVKLLEDREGGGIVQSRDDAPIKGRSLDEGEEETKRVSDDTEEMATVLTFIDVASILTSGGVQVVPIAAEVATTTIGIPTGSGVVSTASLTILTAALIFTTATKSTPYTRRKGKETMVESETLKKKKIAQDAKIARIHAEEELQMLIDGLDRNNETVYVEALQVKHPIIDWEVHTKGQRSYWKIIRLGVKETLNIGLASSNKEMELWVELKRLYEPDVEDQLWTHTQNIMHAPVEWKLYDIDEFPLPEQLPTAYEDKFPLLIQSDATAERIAPLLKICDSHGQRHSYDIQRRVTVTQLFKESVL